MRSAGGRAFGQRILDHDEFLARLGLAPFGGDDLAIDAEHEVLVDLRDVRDWSKLAEWSQVTLGGQR